MAIRQGALGCCGGGFGMVRPVSAWGFAAQYAGSEAWLIYMKISYICPEAYDSGGELHLAIPRG